MTSREVMEQHYNSISDTTYRIATVDYISVMFSLIFVNNYLRIRFLQICEIDFTPTTVPYSIIFSEKLNWHNLAAFIL